MYFTCPHVLNTETRQAFSKLLALTMEPKSAEIRKGSQKVITDLFNLNTAGFSLMLRGVPRNLQVLEWVGGWGCNNIAGSYIG